jgi:hypothetical protein
MSRANGKLFDNMGPDTCGADPAVSSVESLPACQDACSEVVCTDCSSPVPASAPEGLCPKCLFKMGLQKPEDTWKE